MPLDGSGSWVPAGSSWNPPVTNTTINSTDWIALLADLKASLSTAMFKDGQATPTANIPFGSFAITGLGSGLGARTRGANIADVQDGTSQWIASGGSADAITATYAPAITALIDGQICFFRATAANTTTTPTFAPNGLTARTIVKRGGTALVAADIPNALAECFVRYNLANTRWELLNPAVSLSSATLGTPVATTSGTNIDFTGIPTGVKRIIINFSGVSTNGTTNYLIQLGDSGGIETNGYLSTGISIATGGTVSGTTNTAGFVIASGAAANALSGSLILSLENVSTFTWTANGQFDATTTALKFLTSGGKSTSAVTDRVRITTTGSDTFDAGEINISWE